VIFNGGMLAVFSGRGGSECRSMFAGWIYVASMLASEDTGDTAFGASS
jgi:hypothetical protein